MLSPWPYHHERKIANVLQSIFPRTLCNRFTARPRSAYPTLILPHGTVAPQPTTIPTRAVIGTGHPATIRNPFVTLIQTAVGVAPPAVLRTDQVQAGTEKPLPIQIRKTAGEPLRSVQVVSPILGKRLAKPLLTAAHTGTDIVPLNRATIRVDGTTTQIADLILRPIAGEILWMAGPPATVRHM